MKQTSRRTLTVVAGALSACMFTCPLPSTADPYRYDNDEAWRGVQHERREAKEARDALREDQAQAAHEREELRDQQRALHRSYRHDTDD